eukprot:TRINITY_DN6821_c0_g2_i3.p1 TRINITY_DN6821_c0_g2~~TRINITY_DN6821_c0_g2_i3.p1  ORF type:complete len:351 (-),score=45.71 TRINITY_DN6821_c0_g2_i3:426-1478(-)
MDGDEAVQATNDDAQQSKASCVRLGYFQDDFVHFFVKQPVQKAPLLNRGYYTRHKCMASLLDGFLSACSSQQPPQPCQVVVLGAGFDTTFFQSKSRGTTFVKYVELDFQETTLRKTMIISKEPALKSVLELNNPTEIDGRRGTISSPQYCLQHCDLRDIEQVNTALNDAGVDRTLPTYFLSECVLVYMLPRESNALLNWLASNFPTAAIVIYEQIKPDTQFGQQMVKNLEARGAPLFGVKETPTLEAHEARLLKQGWQRAFSADLNRIYMLHTEPVDRVRIETLEVFDEFEEWHLIMGHYCVVVGVNDGGAGLLADYAFPEFDNVDIATAKPLAGGIPVIRRQPFLPNAD